MSTRSLRNTCASLLLLIGPSVRSAAPDKESKPTEIAEIKGQWFVSDLAFSPDSKFLAIADVGDKGVRLWNVANGKIARILPHRQALRVQFSPDGKVVATIGRHFKLWDAASGKELATFKFVPGRWVLFSSDSKKLAAFGKDEVVIISVEKMKKLRSYDISPSRRAVFTYPSSKNPVYAVIRRNGESVALVDPFTEKEVLKCETPITPSFLAFDLEEKILVARNEEKWKPLRGQFGSEVRGGEVWVWDRGKQKAIGNYRLADVGVMSMALSPDGKVMAAYISDAFSPGVDGYILFYDVLTGRLLAREKQATHIITDPSYEASRFLAFSPDGRLLATSFNTSAVKLWSLPESWRKKK